MFSGMIQYKSLYIKLSEKQAIFCCSCSVFATLWTFLSLTISWSLFKFMSFELVMPSNHLILYHPLLLLPSVFPASGSFPVSKLFVSGGQSIGASASASVPPINIQDWFPLELTVLISWQPKALSRIFSSSTIHFYFFWMFLFFFCFKILFIVFFLILIFTLFYFTILYWFCHTLTWIQHGGICVPKHEPPSHLPPHNISLGHHRAPAPSMLYPVSDIDWRFDSYVIVYMLQCHSPKSSHPLPLPQSPKVRSTHLCLFCCLAYKVVIAIFLNSIYMC